MRSVNRSALARLSAAWRTRVARINAPAPEVIAALLLIGGMGLTVHAVDSLAGGPWAMLLGGIWLLVSGLVLMRGAQA